MKYTAKEAIFSGKDIIGYELINENNQVKRAKLSDVIQLVENGFIDGAIIARDSSGIKHVSFKEMPTNHNSELKLTVINRVIKESKLDYYICSDESGRKLKVSPDRLWEYASLNMVSNIDSKMINNQRVLIGKGINMLDIEVKNT